MKGIMEMKKDKKIKHKVIQLKDRCEIFLDYISNFDECAYSDRLVETIIQVAKDLEKDYEKQFKEQINNVKEK